MRWISSIFLGAGLIGLAACTSQPELTFRGPASSSHTTTSRSSSIPSSVLITVPFQSQAPDAVWDDFHEESCEEASLLLAEAYFKSEVSLPPDVMEERLQALIGRETAAGYDQDITIEQAAVVATDMLGLSVRVLTDVTEADLLRELADGHPIVAPFAGRLLGNPYFSGEGPWYHMLVIIGYNNGTFVTNDVGTRRGEHYAYERDVLMEALHNWTGVKEDIERGAKTVLVIDGLAADKQQR